MPAGKQCRAYALRDEYFCYFHSRLHQAAKQPVNLIDSFDIPLLEDRCTVQLTLTRVLRAFVNKTIDRPSASTLLYGLQLALQSVDSGDWAIGFDTVEGLARTPDGDIVACDPDEDFENDDDEIEDEEEEEEPSDATGDSGDEDGSEDNDDEEDEDDNLENESTAQLIADCNQLQSVRRAVEAGDMRQATRLLRLGG
jgi:hypothetical protein